mgnify:CR=1 FL=1
MANSPKAKRPKADIVLPVSREDIRIDLGGTVHTFAVDYDDARNIYAFLAEHRRVMALIEAQPDEADAEYTEKVYAETWAGIVEAVESVLGTGACERLFEGRQSVHAGMVLMTELAKKVGPAYDQMFSGYEPSEV